MAKLKILHVIGAGKPGGAETFALRLIAAQARHPQLEVKVVARVNGWLAPRLRAAGVRVVEAPFGGTIWEALLASFGLGTAARIKRAAENFKPDVIQGWMNRGARFIPQGSWAKVARLGGFYKLKNYFGRVDYLIGNTPEIVEYCTENGWPAARVSYLTNFVPLPVAGFAQQRARIRKKLGLPQGAVALLMAGRLHRVKGIDTAIAALATLPESVHLLLAGEGPLREEMGHLAKSLGVEDRVHFLGWVDDVTPYAAAADIWLAPSRYEPLGNTVIDGWVHKVPVIATRTGGLKLLIKDGVSGLLVKVDDEAGLADAIAKLMRSPMLCRRLIKGGLARYAEEFSQSMVVKRYVDYYRSLAAANQESRA